MQEREIIKLWKQGLDKYKLADIYKRRYNQQIKIIRAEVVNRHKGRYISNYEALAVVERVIYKYIKCSNCLNKVTVLESKLDKASEE